MTTPTAWEVIQRQNIVFAFGRVALLGPCVTLRSSVAFDTVAHVLRASLPAVEGNHTMLGDIKEERLGKSSGKMRMSRGFWYRPLSTNHWALRFAWPSLL